MEQNTQQLLYLIVAVLVCPLAVCVMSGLSMIPLWRRNRMADMLGWLAVVASLISLVFSIAMALIPPPPQHPLTSVVTLPLVGDVNLLLDAVSIYFILLINTIACASSWNTVTFLRGQIWASRWRSPASFHFFAQLFHVTMVLVPLMNNLIALWVMMQATTLVSTLLISFQGNKNALEAAWKYLMITSTGIVFALLGTIFLANAAQPASDNGSMDWTSLMQNAATLRENRNLVKLSFLFILVGYGVKAGFAPMHSWLPDGHGEAPAPISAMLSGVLLKAALYAILRFYTIANAALGSSTFTSEVLLASAMLSLLIATPFILKRNRFKRVLAYHSLEHMGIITFGLGIGGSVALFGALLHVLNHAVTKALMFLSFGNIWQQYEQAARARGEATAQPTGVLQSMPLTGAILTLGGLALVGIPPFNVFMSELIMLWSALTRITAGSALSTQTTMRMGLNPSPHLPLVPPGDQAALWWFTVAATIVFLFSTTLIFYGLIRHLADLMLGSTPHGQRFQERLIDLVPLIVLLSIAVVSGVWMIPPLARLIILSVEIISPSAI